MARNSNDSSLNKNISSLIAALSLLIIEILTILVLPPSIEVRINSVFAVLVSITAVLVFEGVIERRREDDRSEMIDSINAVLVSLEGKKVTSFQSQEGVYKYMYDRIDTAHRSVSILGIPFGALKNNYFGSKVFLAVIAKALRRGLRVEIILYTGHLSQQVGELDWVSDFAPNVRFIPASDQKPAISIVVIDGNEVFWGEFSSGESEEVLWTNHAKVVSTCEKQFSKAWSKASPIGKKMDDVLFWKSVEIGRYIESEATYRLINQRDAIYRLSDQLVIEKCNDRLWTTSFSGSRYSGDSPLEEKFGEIVDQKLLASPLIEHRWITTIDSHTQLDELKSQLEERSNLDNFLCGVFLEPQPTINVFLSDSNTLMFGFRSKAAPPSMNEVIHIDDPKTISMVSDWFRDNLWASAIPLKDRSGVRYDNFSKLEEYLGYRESVDLPYGKWN